jgi:hypothetical protein
MKVQPTLLFILLINFQFLFSQDVGLSVFTIPDSLIQNANAVVRFDNTSIALESSKKMKVKVKKAITVLNKLGNDNSEIVVYYDKSNHIKRLKAIVYNALGKEIKDISKKDFKDYSAADGFSLFNDGRLKYYEYIPTSYPYTIYYEYEVESSNTAFIRRWRPIDSYNQSVQQSIFTIVFPNDLTIHKVEKKFKGYPIDKNISAGSLSYKLNAMPAIKYENLAPPLINITPLLKLASNKFSLEGIEGTANNWNEFGKWMYNNLLSSRSEIPEATKLKIKELVKDVENPIEKAKIVYEYVQNKTRYISVQVGIGGWMPMLAKDVDRLGYGDCKALTNYTKSLMDVAGVTSYYTAVYADNPKQDMERDVVSVQGNHVFLYIPSKEKDIWLECTSQSVPFGYQGTFTDDREVLVISPEGGQLKHTSAYKDTESFQKTHATYTITPEGSIKATVKISSAGVQYRNHFSLEKQSKRDIEEHYKSRYWPYINNMAIDNYHFVNDKDSIVFNEFVTLKAADYASFSGDRMLFALNAFNRLTYIPKRYRNRKLPLEISRGFIDKDEFEIILPDTYDIEAIPNDITIENKFGSYHLSVEKINPTKLKYTRTLLIKKGEYPKEDYKNYRSFRKKIAKLDKTKIVLIKK